MQYVELLINRYNEVDGDFLRRHQGLVFIKLLDS